MYHYVMVSQMVHQLQKDITEHVLIDYWVPAVGILWEIAWVRTTVMDFSLHIQLSRMNLHLSLFHQTRGSFHGPYKQ